MVLFPLVVSLAGNRSRATFSPLHLVGFLLGDSRGFSLVVSPPSIPFSSRGYAGD